MYTKTSLSSRLSLLFFISSLSFHIVLLRLYHSLSFRLIHRILFQNISILVHISKWKGLHRVWKEAVRLICVASTWRRREHKVRWLQPVRREQRFKMNRLKQWTKGWGGIVQESTVWCDHCRCVMPALACDIGTEISRVRLVARKKHSKRGELFVLERIVVDSLFLFFFFVFCFSFFYIIVYFVWQGVEGVCRAIAGDANCYATA